MYKCQTIFFPPIPIDKIYDKYNNASNVEQIQDLEDCCAIFICVPTPMDKDTGECHINIVDSVIQELQNCKKILGNHEDYFNTYRVTRYIN